MKKLVFLSILGLGIYTLLNLTVCNGMKYHDYAAGIDRTFSCPWKK